MLGISLKDLLKFEDHADMLCIVDCLVEMGKNVKEAKQIIIRKIRSIDENA